MNKGSIDKLIKQGWDLQLLASADKSIDSTFGTYGGVVDSALWERIMIACMTAIRIHKGNQ